MGGQSYQVGSTNRRDSDGKDASRRWIAERCVGRVVCSFLAGWDTGEQKMW